MGFVSNRPENECKQLIGKYVDELVVLPRIPGYHQIALAKMASTWLLGQYGEELVMIGDMDRIPLSSKFIQMLADEYSGGIRCTGHELYTGELAGKIPMCYTFAKSAIWKELICPAQSFVDFLKQNSNTKQMFDKKEDALKSGKNFSDESIIRTFLSKRPQPITNVCRIFEPVKDTIDRKKWHINKKRLEEGSYVECHSIRPTKENMPRLQPLFDFFEVEQI